MAALAHDANPWRALGGEPPAQAMESTSARRARTLLGRRAECEFLDTILADALAGRSRVVVLRGEAGAGKSSLLDFVAERGTDWHIATAVGIESEMELAYSGLHQLCSPMLDYFDRLPAPQHGALATVFGHEPGPHRIDSWLGSPRSRCWQRPRIGNRSSASSTTHSGSTMPRRRSSLRRPPIPRGADRCGVRGPYRRSATTSWADCRF